MSQMPGSNQRPTDYKSVALPAELIWPIFFSLPTSNAKRIRVVLKNFTLKHSLPVFQRSAKVCKNIFCTNFFSEKVK